MSKIALHIIAKDQVEAVKLIIEKYASYFDEIAIAPDQRVEEFQALATDKIKIHPYVWCDDFAHKRNFLAEHTQSDLYLRLDTDDEIENPQLIAELTKVMDEQGFDLLYIPYIYAKDETGNCVAKHWRETVIRKKEGIVWNKTIHENILLGDKSKVKILRDDRLKIIHNIDDAHAQASYERNLKACVLEFQNDKEKTDPRTIAYIGRMLMSKGFWDRAVLFLEQLIRTSGWDDDKYFAWIHMSQCYQQMGKTSLALNCCNEALLINTKFPDAFLQMGAVYLQIGDYDKAVDWIMPGTVRPEPDTVMVIDPSFYGYKAKINAALALLGKGDITLAMRYYNEAKKIAPKEAYVIEKEKLFTDAFENDQYIKSLAFVANHTAKLDRTKLKPLMESMPRGVFLDERASAIRNNYMPHRVWADDEIAIFCGISWEEWAPVSTFKGIGGSEEAVIYLSRELAKLGYKVTVYNQCGDMAGTYDGVEYKNFHEFNQNDIFNILVGWRMDNINSVKAKKKVIWLHDVPQEGMFTPHSITNIDKIIVLSEFHKSLLPDFIPQDKIFVSANGINLPDFRETGIIRDSKRMIYTSSYDRGLQHILEAWPQVKAAVPEATLHIFYGWNTYDEMVKAGRRNNDFKVVMTQLMAQDGITEHGRVGHKQLVKEFQKSGLWVYPTHFEEISCISAMKAQACGCVPVCTDYAALAETVKAGVILKGRCDSEEKLKDFQDALIAILTDDARQDTLRQDVLSHKDEFGWDRVAKQWHGEMFAASIPWHHREVTV